MNQQPKTSYQDFLKDIYSAMKKINQTTGEIFTKLETLDMRIANLEKSYVLLSGDVKKILNESRSGPENSPAKQTGSAKLLSLLTQLNDSANDVDDNGMSVYTLGTNTALEAVFNNPKPSPSFNIDGIGSPDSEDNYGSLIADISPVKLPLGSSIMQNSILNSIQNSAYGNMNDDFMILE